jgi:hypothetical protein
MAVRIHIHGYDDAIGACPVLITFISDNTESIERHGLDRRLVAILEAVT